MHHLKNNKYVSIAVSLLVVLLVGIMLYQWFINKNSIQAEVFHQVDATIVAFEAYQEYQIPANFIIGTSHLYALSLVLKDYGDPTWSFLVEGATFGIWEVATYDSELFLTKVPELLMLLEQIKRPPESLSDETADAIWDLYIELEKC